MALIKPKALGKGSTIGLVAPAIYLEETDIEAGVAVLHKMGYKTKVHPQCHLRHHCRAGTAKERAAAIHDMFTDPEVDGILCVRGGSGAMRTEAHLDYDLIRQNPKFFGGFSDITLLLHSLQQKAGLVTFHAPVLNYISREDTLTLAHFADVVAGNKVSVEIPKSERLKKGTARGKLIGGNLTLLSLLMGTPDAPDTQGAILFIEDVAEPHYKLDRCLWHLKRAGKLENISGVIIGEMPGVGQTYATKTNESYGLTIWESVQELFKDKNIPIVANAPIGHTDRMLTFPLGIEATLRVTNKNASLTLEESATDLTAERQAS